MFPEEEEARDELLYKIIVERFELEWKRTNDLDSKASNVTTFAGLLVTLTGGIIAGIGEILPQMHYKYLFIIPLLVFVSSAIFGLLAYWLTDFAGINPETLIQEYGDRSKIGILRTVIPTISILTMTNFERNQEKARWLYIAFLSLVLAVVLFFAITIVNWMY